MTKKLDTYESKRSCRHNHNIADTNISYDVLALTKELGKQLFPVVTSYIASIQYIPTIFFSLPHAPPWDGGNLGHAFLQTYIGISLLLL